MISQNSQSKVIIQLRGTNASGKSTAMRQYCALYGLKPSWLDIPQRRIKVMRNGQIATLGWYRPFSDAEGCDAAVQNKGELMSALAALCEEGCEVIAFEGMIYSQTYLLPNKVNDLAKRYGYKFIAVFLACSYTTELQRLMSRNGGKDVDYDAFDKRYLLSRRAFGKIRQSSILSYEANTDQIPYEQMGGIIDRARRELL